MIDTMIDNNTIWYIYFSLCCREEWDDRMSGGKWKLLNLQKPICDIRKVNPYQKRSSLKADYGVN